MVVHQAVLVEPALGSEAAFAFALALGLLAGAGTCAGRFKQHQGSSRGIQTQNVEILSWISDIGGVEM